MNTDEHQIKHLEFVQGVISRMAGNSFLLKGWCVTLVAALFALAAQGANQWYALVGLLPGLVFWGLDAYYLRQERLFRKLYDAVRRGELDTDRYCMNTQPYSGHVQSVWRTAWSLSVGWLHGAVVIAVLAVTVVLVITSRLGAETDGSTCIL